jgi:L-ascorbate metabolism protein UlaG (beta-lactamase superfamily)
MIPVGGTYTIGPEEAAKVISSLEPGLVIPMHFQTEDLTGLSKELAPLDKFMDEMGIENNSKAKDKLVLKSKKDIPSETEIVILKPAH